MGKFKEGTIGESMMQIINKVRPIFAEAERFSKNVLEKKDENLGWAKTSLIDSMVHSIDGFDYTFSEVIVGESLLQKHRNNTIELENMEELRGGGIKTLYVNAVNNLISSAICHDISEDELYEYEYLREPLSGSCVENDLKILHNYFDV